MLFRSGINHVRACVHRQACGCRTDRSVDIRIRRISDIRKFQRSGRGEHSDRAVRFGIACSVRAQHDRFAVVNERLRRAVPRRVHEERVNRVRTEIFSAVDIIRMVVRGIVFAVEEIDNIVDSRRALCLRIDIIRADRLQPFVFGRQA